ncbi:3-oxoacid CoA-transferase subunit B [Aminipila luticellarii]|uniref:3-oxoacid CoA-transferase subunit B n=1 Tax=Aminipila luticellarii TaxID=2507160 RepID=A0A410PYR9_9FIRM|nr:3-oxoacid CoA-transferase subunit B [Aminipila luticellarii]QAT44000.1 3-oxoacid CoA-transferase subunit B [Aminipila luticellarii]
MNNEKEIIARRVAMEIEDGNVVNLGIGLPEMVANYIPDTIDVEFQAENGILGMGGTCKAGEENKDVINAGFKYVQVKKGAMFFDSATSFAIIRGGHVDVTVLGVLEIDETGTFASHKIPGKKVPGMGGAMDLVMGAKKVIVATTHTKKDGGKKIIKKVSLPITAVSKVDLIITELAVIRVTEQGLVLEEINENTTIEKVQERTEPKLIISKNLKVMFSE